MVKYDRICSLITWVHVTFAFIRPWGEILPKGTYITKIWKKRNWQVKFHVGELIGPNENIPIGLF